MTKNEFIKLINNAKVDENGNLYYIDNSFNIDNRVYFATITTICKDFVTTYCYDIGGKAFLYDNHFTQNDDTLEINIVKELQEEQKKFLANNAIDEAWLKGFNKGFDKGISVLKELAEKVKEELVTPHISGGERTIIDEVLKEYIGEE